MIFIVTFKNFTADSIQEIGLKPSIIKRIERRKKKIYNKIIRAAKKGKNNITVRNSLVSPEIYQWLSKKNFLIDQKKVIYYEDIGCVDAKYYWKISW